MFKRFDSFVERLHTMLEFFSTAVQVRNISGRKSLSLLRTVHEAGESGDWWDPWESLDEQHWQGLRGVQGETIVFSSKRSRKHLGLINLIFFFVVLKCQHDLVLGSL